jgi:hypothetical protein
MRTGKVCSSTLFHIHNKSRTGRRRIDIPIAFFPVDRAMELVSGMGPEKLNYDGPPYARERSSRRIAKKRSISSGVL